MLVLFQHTRHSVCFTITKLSFFQHFLLRFSKIKIINQYICIDDNKISDLSSNYQST